MVNCFPLVVKNCCVHHVLYKTIIEEDQDVQTALCCVFYFILCVFLNHPLMSLHKITFTVNFFTTPTGILLQGPVSLCSHNGFFWWKIHCRNQRWDFPFVAAVSASGHGIWHEMSLLFYPHGRFYIHVKKKNPHRSSLWITARIPIKNNWKMMPCTPSEKKSMCTYP